MLWATHLIDEVFDGDDVIVLHKGEVVAQGIGGRGQPGAGASTIADSFDRLTGGSANEPHPLRPLFPTAY